MFAALSTYRDALAAIDGVASCAIGIEADISPADYPLIRLVPRRITPGREYGKRTAETIIYFGVDKSASEGLESVYESLSALEAAIIATLQPMGGRYVETLTDEDRLDTYKLMSALFNLTV